MVLTEEEKRERKRVQNRLCYCKRREKKAEEEAKQLKRRNQQAESARRRRAAQKLSKHAQRDESTTAAPSSSLPPRPPTTSSTSAPTLPVSNMSQQAGTPQSFGTPQAFRGTPQAPLPATPPVQMQFEPLPSTPSFEHRLVQFTHSVGRSATQWEMQTLREASDSDFNRATIAQTARDAYAATVNITAAVVGALGVPSVPYMYPSQETTARNLAPGMETVFEYQQLDTAPSTPVRQSVAKKRRNDDTPSSRASSTSSTKKPRASSAKKPRASSAKKPRASGKKASEKKGFDPAQVGAAFVDQSFKIGTIPKQVINTDTNAPKVDYKMKCDYSHMAAALVAILQHNEDSCIFVYKEDETCSVGPTQFGFDVFYCLIAPAGVMPPELLVLRAGGDYLEEYVRFSDLSLEWTKASCTQPFQELLGDCASRVFFLKNNSRNFRNLDERTERLFRASRLVDCRPQEFPPLDGKGRVEVFKVAYTCNIDRQSVSGTYAIGGEFAEELDWVIEEFSDKGVTAPRCEVKAAIAGAFEEERERIRGIVADVHAKHDPGMLGMIRLAKIYPKNIAELAPLASNQELELMLYSNPTEPLEAKRRRNSLQAALQHFSFEPSRAATCYGPAEHIFIGTAMEDAAAPQPLD